MSYSEWTESDIQALKAQEAKDLALEFLQALQEKEVGPISPGEVQLRELEYDLKLKQAEVEDARNQREHELQLRELELQLEEQRAKAAEARSRADEVRQELQQLVERVRNSEDSLAISLERSTREHRLKLEQLEQEYAERRQNLEMELEELTGRRDTLAAQITELSALQVDAEQLAQTAASLAEKQNEVNEQRQTLEHEIAALQFERTKQITAVQQEQELELSRLKHQHQTQVLELDRGAADQILSGLNLVAIEQQELDRLHHELGELRQAAEAQSTANEALVRQQLRAEFNITSDQPIDVTALHYEHKAAREEIARLEKRVDYLEQELTAARQHIQSEPQRIATAIEAARTPIQNFVEPATKR